MLIHRLTYVYQDNIENLRPIQGYKRTQALNHTIYILLLDHWILPQSGSQNPLVNLERRRAPICPDFMYGADGIKGSAAVSSIVRRI